MSNYRANAAGSDRKQHGQVFIMNAEAFIQTYSSCALWRKCHWSECQKSVEVYGWRLDRPWLRPLSASVAWSPTGLSSPYLLFGPGQCQICSKQWDLENQPKPNGQALCDSHFSEKEGGIDGIQCWDSKSWFFFLTLTWSPDLQLLFMLFTSWNAVHLWMRVKQHRVGRKFSHADLSTYSMWM